MSSSTLLVLIERFRAALVEFDPLLHTGEECGELVEALAVAEKASAAVRVRAAARAGSCGAHKERGFADPSDWLARVAGTSSSAAKSALDTAAALSEMPEVRAAVDAGELSMAQATELVKTEATCPGSVAELLSTAKSSSLKTLKEQARERRQRAMSAEELYAVQRRAREFRYWRTALGTIAFRGELPPDFGVPIMNRLDAETDRLWQQAWSSAKASGSADAPEREMEPRRALAADAFLRLVETGGKGKAQQADLVVVCDLRAYRRGHAHDGEPCHVVGGGPIPVSVARELGRDAFLKAVLHDGTRIDTIAHFGRRSSTVLQTALMLGAPPDFAGVACSHPSCDRSYGLERDHIDPVANGGPTSFDNIGWLCKPHHRVKTQRDRKAGLLPRQPSLSAARRE